MVVDTTYYKSKQLKGIGNVAFYWDSIKSSYKVGTWTEYFENGKIKSKGDYQIDSYITCCSSGPCFNYRNYKIGAWKYFYDNGQLEAEGTYKVKLVHINTTCEGGDRVNKALITRKWKFYDRDGKIIPVNDSIKNEMEK
ncbi:MAG TPA: hypothetical protein VL651_16540 [Bacteroidia bacterium]|jgi:antitoxin component YwqK of YwqJK toxin-antitoxin module|nr:hypothetical protein [Bacteroidia bacterium]